MATENEADRKIERENESICKIERKNESICEIERKNENIYVEIALDWEGDSEIERQIEKVEVWVRDGLVCG